MSCPANFADRHIGADNDGMTQILHTIGAADLEDFADAVLPNAIRLGAPLDLPDATSEAAVLAELRQLADKCRPMRQLIGMGYYETITPGVIRRSILENPAWYTAYTPYQPEISQGRLEALLNFQTMVADLTGLPVAGASMLDEATAAAEAMALCHRASRSKSNRFVVDADTLPQTIAVLHTRAEPVGIQIEVADLTDGAPIGDFFGILLSYPGASGNIRPLQDLVDQAHTREALTVVACDLLALTLLKPPGEFGADIAIGSAQRFGVPIGFGGPHAGFLSVRDRLARQLPGRLVGVSKDAAGQPAYRLALQTREQHIRREKATSNICTAQVLLAIMASMYAVYHGPDGLRAIAATIRAKTLGLAAALRGAGIELDSQIFFDTIRARVPGRAAQVLAAARARGINVWADGQDVVQVSLGETVTADELCALAQAFGVDACDIPVAAELPDGFARTSDFLTHEVFASYRNETAMLRYLRRLCDRDLALDRSMIPLGSCTMKLNAVTEMEAITWPEFTGLHPFAPAQDAAGLLELVDSLQEYLAEITGYAAVSVQPNAGSQGEFAGLLAIRAYHRARGQAERTVCLIPASAHGTNAASAAMAGLRVVVVATADDGSIDLADLRAKVKAHADELAAIMVTYPSTHGVYEDTIGQVSEMVHQAGGQVYVDGANLNALVGLAKPGQFGGDVSHLNLHKTFCIPHGGGGPGVGPVAVAAHLAPYLPQHPLAQLGGLDPAAGGVGPVSAAPYGSASILPISWAYIRLMGPAGLRRASLSAVAAANYIATRLAEFYPVLYTDRNGRVAHECILDLRPMTAQTGVSVDDVAKRLADYGFHAPTMSFPVAGTLMVEPTESEDLAELDRFCQAMIAIRAEIDQVAAGRWPLADSPLRHAPHTAADVAGDWGRPYSRAEGVFPPGVSPADKYFPPVGRIDGAFGDRNLMCSCPPMAVDEP